MLKIKYSIILLAAINILYADNRISLDNFEFFRNKNNSRDVCYTKPYEMNNKLIVGSQQDDARVVYSTGVILKVWIAPYHMGETLISSHSNYVVVEAPKFLVGESVKKSGTPGDGFVGANRDIPYVFRSEEVDRESNTKKLSNNVIREFNNNMIYSRESQNIPADNRIRESDAAYDNEILNFIGGKSKRGSLK